MNMQTRIKPAHTKSPRPDDIAIGARIRERRVILNMSQESLGAALNVTFQQIQKYEKGTNRVSGSRMVDICRVLGMSPEQILGSTATDRAYADDVRQLSTPAIRLAMLFDTIESPEMRTSLMMMANAAAPKRQPAVV